MKLGEGLFDYDVDIITYTRQGQKIASDCNEIQFWNEGQDTCIINNNLYLNQNNNPRVTSPYTPLIIRGNFGEIDRTQYFVTFQGSDVSGGGRLVVIRKMYKNPERVAEYLKAIANGKVR